MNRSIRSKLHDPSALCKKRVVGANPDEIAGVIPRSALTDDDAARRDFLPAVNFHAKALGIRVSSVGGTSLTFCMCHVFLFKLSSADFDLFDEQTQKLLPMAVFAPG